MRPRTWVVVIVALLGVAVVVTLIGVSTIFSVTVITERLELATGSAPMPRWPLDSVQIFSGESGEARWFSGFYAPASGVRVTFERVANGPLIVSAESMDGKASVGRLFHESDEPAGELGPFADFVVANIGGRARAGRSIALPLIGVIELGREPGFEAEAGTPLLRSGQVTLLANRLLGGGVFTAGSASLQVGDHFDVVNPLELAYGVLTADERPAMIARFNVRAKRGTVSSLGSVEHEVSASLGARIWHDLSLKIVLGLFGIVAGLLARFGMKAQQKVSPSA